MRARQVRSRERGVDFLKRASFVGKRLGTQAILVAAFQVASSESEFTPERVVYF